MNKDILFVHVPKVAGRSMMEALRKNGLTEYECYGNYRKPPMSFTNKGSASFDHLDVLELIREGVIDKDWFFGAYKFTFVRNPYDRLVSLYFYLRESNLIDLTMTFEQFIDRIYNNRGKIKKPVYPEDRKGWLYLALPQTDITSYNKIDYDFIGTYECLSEDWERLCKEIGINEPLSHNLKTGSRPIDFMEMYSSSTVVKVNEIYRSDFINFMYPKLSIV